ncbi:MAG: ribonuclease P protein component [Nanoarchaeota archaeon]|nr:ribonuclease P protein component [Nanoarchaeota archaeon]
MTRAVTIKIQKKETGRRLTVVVGTKVSKKATERNKIRRRVRAIMRDKKKDEGKEYVVIAHPGAKTLSFQELKNEIEKQLLIPNS